MNLKVLSGIVLTLLLAGTVGIVLFEIRTLADPSVHIVDPREGEGTHYNLTQAMADPDVKDGDVIWVHNGTYHEHVHVNKSVTIKATLDHIPVFDGSGEGIVFWVTKNDVQIFNLTIRNGRDGIRLNTTATHCNVSSNFVHLNKRYGIYVASSDNTLRNNNMTNNTYNFGISNFINNDVDPSNTVHGKPVYIWVDEHYRQVPPDAGYIVAVNSTNIVVENLTLSNNDCGVRLINTSNSTIANVEASHNLNDGVYLFNAENNRVQNVNALHNGDLGISLRSSNSSLVTGNIIANNLIGISLWSNSKDNTLIENTIQNNYVGIQDFHCTSNKFYHNNIKNSEWEQVAPPVDSYESWDNNAEGNYWSDYIDKYPDAGDVDGDGIWDHPYEIDPNNYDRCPLVKPWKSFRLFNVAKAVDGCRFKGYNLTVHSDHVIASLNFTIIGEEESYPRRLSFNVTAGSFGFCNITIRRAWLDGPFNLSINNAPRSFDQITQNASHSSLYFTFGTGKHQVKIVGIKSGAMKGDLDNNGFVDVRDVSAVARHYGDLLPTNLTPIDITEYDP